MNFWLTGNKRGGKIPPILSDERFYGLNHITGPIRLLILCGVTISLVCVLRYKLRGAPVSHMCTANAVAAMECGKFEMARMWKILKILTISTAMPTSSLNSLEDNDPQFIYKMNNIIGFTKSPSEASRSPSSVAAANFDEDSYQHSFPGSQIRTKVNPSPRLSMKPDWRMESFYSSSQAPPSVRVALQGIHDTGKGVSRAIYNLI